MGDAEWEALGPRAEIAFSDARFPETLRQLERPPRRLRCIGDASLLRRPALSIIGARKSTPYGRGLARRFAARAAARDVVVVSGGALGCDSEAHEGALDASGPTIVVLGGGCDAVYPASNKPLFRRIVEGGGLLVSEQDWKTPPRRYMFPMRNRLIAALSRATLIVEAGLPSGTFSTADEALAANRDVWAVPGAITSPTSFGSNRLIGQGAVPVVDDETFDYLLCVTYGLLRGADAERAPVRFDELIGSDPLLGALAAQPLHVEELLAALTGPGAANAPDGEATPAQVLLRLSRLECEGVVCRDLDGRYRIAMEQP